MPPLARGRGRSAPRLAQSASDHPSRRQPRQGARNLRPAPGARGRPGHHGRGPPACQKWQCCLQAAP
eukprot:161271-Lingulodinium_polyedra.AAC.1